MAPDMKRQGLARAEVRCYRPRNATPSPWCANREYCSNATVAGPEQQNVAIRGPSAVHLLGQIVLLAHLADQFQLRFQPIGVLFLGDEDALQQ